MANKCSCKCSHCIQMGNVPKKAGNSKPKPSKVYVHPLERFASNMWRNVGG